MKLINLAKVGVLMAMAIHCANADTDRITVMTDEEINKFYSGNTLPLSGAQAQRKRIKQCEQLILDSKNLTADQAYLTMGSKLVSISQLNVAERVATYDRLQATLLAMPGYGDYYTNLIEQNYAKAAASETAYDERMLCTQTTSLIFDILPHLPGPETIKLLGHYLYDTRPTPFEPEGCGTKEVDSNPAIVARFKLMGTNSYVAARGLSKIGVRNLLTEKNKGFDAGYVVESIALQKAWWEKVKAGQIPFSFIGQTAEYRFRPDATWETTQLPVSVLERDKNPATPAQAPSAVRAEKRDLPEPSVLAKTNAENAVSPARRYLLPTSGLLALLLGAWYFLRSRKAT